MRLDGPGVQRAGLVCWARVLPALSGGIAIAHTATTTVSRAIATVAARC